MKIEHIPGIDRFVKFHHRDTMRKRHPKRQAYLRSAIPPVTLPIDNSNNGACSCPMDGNNTLGDCGPAMCAHVDNLLTYGCGQPGWTESTFPLAALEQQYLKISGGDNGTDEQMLVSPGGIWVSPNGIAGNSAAIVVDSLDVDVTNAPLVQYLLDNNFLVCMAWSVPTTFLNGFTPGSSWNCPAIPNPNNGHYTPLSDVDAGGRYRLWTWGASCWVTPCFVGDVDPQCFTVFSTRSFNAKGFDCKGVHISTRAAAWAAIGGSPISPAVIAAFPPLTPVAPPPVVPPVTPPAAVYTLTLPKGCADDAREIVCKSGVYPIQVPVAIPPGTTLSS